MVLLSPPGVMYSSSPTMAMPPPSLTATGMSSSPVVAPEPSPRISQVSVSML
jgi:hypothetical protein